MLGRLEDAEEISLSIHSSRARHNSLARIALHRDDQQEAREHFHHAGPSISKATFFAMIHDFPRAEREHQNAIDDKKVHPEVFVAGDALYNKLFPGTLALNRGQTAEAIRLLEEAVSVFRHTPYYYYAEGSEMLALALESQGELQGALLVTEEAVHVCRDKYAEILGSGRNQLTLQSHRAQLLRKLERHQEARAIELELANLLTYADPDDTLLRQLKHSQNQEPN
jgi:tetratricopeptide (TPR) repeat protein